MTGFYDNFKMFEKFCVIDLDTSDSPTLQTPFRTGLESRSGKKKKSLIFTR